MKYLTAPETRTLGVVMEVNRRLLHPRGLALEYVRADVNSTHNVVLSSGDIESLREVMAWMRSKLAETYTDEQRERWESSLDNLNEVFGNALESPDAVWLRIQDHRDDAEGVYFDDLDESDRGHALNFVTLAEDREDARQDALGYIVQPQPEC